jgi:hypothetical protein
VRSWLITIRSLSFLNSGSFNEVPYEISHRLIPA